MSQHFTHKKSLGQHFLKSDETAQRIVEALQPMDVAENILEIGPGLGILSKHLLKLNKNIYFSEIDERIISRLKNEFHIADEKIIEGDFLRISLSDVFKEPVIIIGNFPYNISSQILFKVLDHKEIVPIVVGMFQKEMARRVVAKHNNKEYGVITVLVQAYYNCEYLFELNPDEFDPAPKVQSAVIKLTRKKTTSAFDNKLFKQVVKMAFNQRRKKLSNAMLGMQGAKETLNRINFADKRAEQLSVDDFILLTNELNKQTST